MAFEVREVVFLLRFLCVSAATVASKTGLGKLTFGQRAYGRHEEAVALNWRCVAWSSFAST